MADSNPPQQPKSGIPTSASTSLLKKPSTGIPSRLPTASTTVKKSTSASTNIENPSQIPQTNISTSSTPTTSTSSIPNATNLTKIASGSAKNITKQEDEATNSKSSLSSTSSSSIPPPSDLTKAASGSNKNVSKPEPKDQEAPKRESMEKSLPASSIATPGSVSKLLAPTSIKKPEIKTEAKIEPKQETKTEIKQEIKQEVKIDNEEIINLRKENKDLSEKLETLKLKRAEDREKLRELDKLKLQYQQLQEYKTQAQEMISQLNKDLQNYKQEAKTLKEEFGSYKEEMSSHESRLEELTVDKELAEARAEELQEELNKINEKYEETKLELEVFKGEMEVNGAEGIAGSFQIKQKEKEVETLKLALIKLRDLSLQDKNEINTTKKQNEEFNQKLTKMTKEIEILKEEKETFLAQINELNEQVTATLGSEQIIERLSERNLDLESKVSKLEEEIADLEAINEVNDQLQENAREEERELRQNLDLAESRIRESEKQIELLKYNIADHEKTILKFRDLVKQLQSENDSVTRQLKTKIEEEKESINQSVNSSATGQNFDFKHKFFESQIQSKVIENEINLVELQSLRRYNSYLLSFMSDSFLKQSGNNECIMTLLFFKRISSKCDLMLNHFKEKINKINSNESSAKQNLNGQLGFFYDLSVYSSRLKLLCSKFDYILNSCDLKVFLNIGSMYYDFSLNEKQVDSFVDLIQKNQLDENISTEGIDKMSTIFQNIINNHLKEEKYDHNSYLEDVVRYGIFSTESITVEIQRLTTMSEVKDDSSEIFLLFKEIACKNDEIKTSLKKLQRNLPNRDNQQSKNVLLLPNEFLSELENSIDNFSMISKTLKELFSLASNSKIFSSNDTFEALSGKKLESLAYQASDKIYTKDDNGPYENIRNSLKQIGDIFMRASACIENGEYETELSDEEFKIRKYQVNSPIQKAAELFKSALIEAESIKFKLEDKEEEIKELKKNFKIKVDELSEQKLRMSIVEKKAETQQKELEEKIKKSKDEIEEIKSESNKKEKEHTDTLEALQQELDSMEKERRELKEKLRKAALYESVIRQPASDSFNQINSNEMSSMKSQNNFVDTSGLVYEINVLKCQNKLLIKSLNEAKQAYVNKLLNNFPVRSFNNNDFDIVVKNTDEKHKNYVDLTKKTNDLLKDVYSSFANVKIEDLTKKTSHRIDRNKLEEKNIYLQVNKIQNKLENLQKELVKSSDGEKVMDERKNLIAEISMPSLNTSTNKVFDLSVNLDEIKQLLRSF